MKILVINAGSSSLKYQLIDMTDETVIAKGNCERIGVEEGVSGLITHVANGNQEIVEECEFPTHTEAFQKLVVMLMHSEFAVISDLSEISAIGHRVVQGAELFKESVLMTDEVIKSIEGISDLAPLHNPAHVLAMKACKKVFGNGTKQVCVFDTAFHQNMPKKAYMFGIPYEFYKKYHIRKYGFHGTSHRYVTGELANILGKDIKDLKIVSCHLGNGSSIAAVNGGKAIDTSMGFTPLDGLIMGTRSGAVDPSVISFLAEKEGYSAREISDILNKKSGYLGISGLSNDHRDLCAAAAKGNERAALAIDMQVYQIQRYIGSYAAAMNGLDAVIFTGGIGENSIILRGKVCENMSYFGIDIDKDLNEKTNRGQGKISTPSAKTDVWIIPTNEELLIARDTLQAISE